MDRGICQTDIPVRSRTVHVQRHQPMAMRASDDTAREMLLSERVPWRHHEGLFIGLVRSRRALLLLLRSLPLLYGGGLPLLLAPAATAAKFLFILILVVVRANYYILIIDYYILIIGVVELGRRTACARALPSRAECR